MDRLAEFQQATDAAQLEKKASEPAEGEIKKTAKFHLPFQKSSQMEKGEMKGHEAIPPTLSAEDEELQMPMFFAQVIEIKDTNKKISTYTDEIEKLHKEALATGNAEASADASAKVEALMAKVNAMGNKVRRTLQEMERLTKELESKAAKGSANLRMRESNHRQLSKQFMDVMRKYQKMQEIYKDKYRAQLERQYLIVKPNATKDELIELTKNPEAAKTQVFAMAVKEDAKKTLSQMKDRLQDMQNIEKSIMELNQMFLEMQDLVVAQGEVINRIGYHVDEIEEYTFQAKEDLVEAVESQKAIMKKKWIITAVIAVIILIIFIVILSQLRAIFGV